MRRALVTPCQIGVNEETKLRSAERLLLDQEQRLVKLGI